MKILLILSLSLLYNLQINAQETTQDTARVNKQFLITKNNGQEIIGEILSDDGREMLVLTNTIGKVFIAKADVKNIKEITPNIQIVEGLYSPNGPFTTRYAFTTNALPIKKGENYSMINLYGPEVHFAVTDNLNVGIMTTWIASPMVLALKYSFKNETAPVKFAIGTLLGTSGYLRQFRGYGGLHWLSATVGNRSRNFTISGGYAYLFSGNEKTGYSNSLFNYNNYIYNNNNSYTNIEKRGLISGPIFSFAGIIKVGAKVNFVFDSMLGQFSQDVTEKTFTSIYDSNTGNYTNSETRKIVNRSTTAFFLMPGMRFQWTDDKAFQFTITGVSLFGDTEGSFPMPMLSWFRKF